MSSSQHNIYFMRLYGEREWRLYNIWQVLLGPKSTQYFREIPSAPPWGKLTRHFGGHHFLFLLPWVSSMVRPCKIRSIFCHYSTNHLFFVSLYIHRYSIIVRNPLKIPGFPGGRQNYEPFFDIDISDSRCGIEAIGSRRCHHRQSQVHLVSATGVPTPRTGHPQPRRHHQVWSQGQHRSFQVRSK